MLTSIGMLCSDIYSIKEFWQNYNMDIEGKHEIFRKIMLNYFVDHSGVPCL